MARDYKLIVGVNKKIAYVALLQAKPSTCASLRLLMLAASDSPCARLHPCTCMGIELRTNRARGRKREVSKDPAQREVSRDQGEVAHHLLCPCSAAPALHLQHSKSLAASPPRSAAAIWHHASLFPKLGPKLNWPRPVTVRRANTDTFLQPALISSIGNGPLLLPHTNSENCMSPAANYTIPK